MVNVEWNDFFNQSIEIKKDVKRENAISNLKQINDKCRGSQQALLVVRGRTQSNEYLFATRRAALIQLRHAHPQVTQE